MMMKTFSPVKSLLSNNIPIKRQFCKKFFLLLEKVIEGETCSPIFVPIPGLICIAGPITGPEEVGLCNDIFVIPWLIPAIPGDIIPIPERKRSKKIKINQTI